MPPWPTNVPARPSAQFKFSIRLTKWHSCTCLPCPTNHAVCVHTSRLQCPLWNNIIQGFVPWHYSSDVCVSISLIQYLPLLLHCYYDLCLSFWSELQLFKAASPAICYVMLILLLLSVRIWCWYWEAIPSQWTFQHIQRCIILWFQWFYQGRQSRYMKIDGTKHFHHYWVLTLFSRSKQIKKKVPSIGSISRIQWNLIPG